MAPALRKCGIWVSATTVAIAAAWLVTGVLRRGGVTAEGTTTIYVQLTLSSALNRFNHDMGRYPSSREGLMALLRAPESDSGRWKGPYLDAPASIIPKDFWGHEYRYRASATAERVVYEVYSLGPDGIISNDDIGIISK